MRPVSRTTGRDDPNPVREHPHLQYSKVVVVFGSDLRGLLLRCSRCCWPSWHAEGGQCSEPHFESAGKRPGPGAIRSLARDVAREIVPGAG